MDIFVSDLMPKDKNLTDLTNLFPAKKFWE